MICPKCGQPMFGSISSHQCKPKRGAGGPRSNQNSFGQAIGNGPTAPYGQAWRQGWDIRPVTHWDFTNGRMTA